MLSTNDVNRTPVPTKFQPSFTPSQDVIFRPIKPTDAPSLNYVAVIETEEVIHTDTDSEQEDEPPFKKLYNDHQIYSTPTLAQAQTDAPSPDPFSLGKDPIKTFYIGSITVIGLYILYKILNKR
jgi:hypothetical protein